MDERNIITEIIDLVNSKSPFTDIKIDQDEPIMAKTPAGWQPIQGLEPATREDIEKILVQIDPDWENTIGEEMRSISKPLDLTDWRLRVSASLANSGANLSVGIRRQYAYAPALKDTGLPPTVRLMLDTPRGLILVSGSTSSGKSTTLAALVGEINDTRNSHIVTIEDPIEYKARRNKSIFTQREVGVDTISFKDGVREAMRQTPEVIVVGEIRDKETAEMAFLAAESGVLVIGTLHANDAAGAVQKILSFFPADERDAKVQTLQNVLIGVIAQILVPREDRAGWALAAELLFNHKRYFSDVLGDQPKLRSLMEREEEKMSQTMIKSLSALIKGGVISKADAIRAIGSSQQVKLLELLV